MSRKDLKHLFTPGTGAVPPCLPDARRNRSIFRIVLGIDRFLTIQAVFILWQLPGTVVKWKILLTPANMMDHRGSGGPTLDRWPYCRIKNGYWAAIKVLGIKDDTGNDDYDEVTFDYVIHTNSSPRFVR